MDTDTEDEGAKSHVSSDGDVVPDAQPPTAVAPVHSEARVYATSVEVTSRSSDGADVAAPSNVHVSTRPTRSTRAAKAAAAEAAAAEAVAEEAVGAAAGVAGDPLTPKRSGIPRAPLRSLSRENSIDSPLEHKGH